MSVARYGEPFTRTELTELDLGDDVYVGLFVCAHNPKVSERRRLQQRPHRRAAASRAGVRIATTSAATSR